MRFAFVLFLLATFVPTAIADDEKKQSSKEILSPEKQMDLAISEYKRAVTDFWQFERVVLAPALAKGLYLQGRHRELHLAMDKKKSEVVDLHKRLAIPTDPNLYKKSKERRIELGNRADEIHKKISRYGQLTENLNPDKLAKLAELKRAYEDVGIEKSMVTLLETLNEKKKD